MEVKKKKRVVVVVLRCRASADAFEDHWEVNEMFQEMRNDGDHWIAYSMKINERLVEKIRRKYGTNLNARHHCVCMCVCVYLSWTRTQN